MRRAVLLLLASCGRIAFDPTTTGDGSVDVNVGDEIRDEEGSHSGTRLKLVWNELGGSQIRAWSGIYDAARGEDCLIRFGDNRCVPPADDVVYRDASCTQPIARGLPCKLEDYAYGPIGPSARLFKRASVIAGLTQFYAADADGGCVGPYGALAGALSDVGVEVPIGELATVTVARETGSRVVKQFFEAPDGFRLETQAFDTGLDTPCIPGTSATGEGCGPALATFSFQFSDAACTQPVVQSAIGFPPPKFGSDFDPAACSPANARYYTVTGPDAATDPYVAAGGSCFPSTVPTGYSLFTLGAQITPAPLVRRTGAIAGQRIQHIYDEAQGVAFRYGLFDTALGERCTLTTLEDGKRHCVPFSTLPVGEFFSDAACASPISLAYNDRDTACAASTTAFGVRVTVNCSATYFVNALASEFTGTVYQMSGICAPRALGLGLTSTYYTLGAATPPSTFVEPIAVRDP